MTLRKQKRYSPNVPTEEGGVGAFRMEAADALRRLAALCAKGEHCSHDMEEKMRQWGLDEDDIQANIDYLRSHSYIDDARYCRAFVNDKITYNHWGPRKIEQALWQKHIPEDISRPILDEVAEETYTDVLLPMLRTKYRTTKAASEYERACKLIKFAMGRGFKYETIKSCLEQLGSGEDAPDPED